jgi:anti-sigma regulatory factor (Ser/Thr protein kinase)
MALSAHTPVLTQVRQAPITVRDPSQVAGARREAAALGAMVGLGETALGKLAIAVTEASTNLVKHGGGGVIVLRPLERALALGVEVLALDQGRGIANPGKSLRDGVSTSGSPGTGLGALSRLTSGFDFYTQQDKGTALCFEVWPDAKQAAPERLPSGMVCVPKEGEDVSGDGWLIQSDRARYTLLVVDGLGHGPDAAHAANAAKEAVAAASPSLRAAELIDVIHGALRSTRGAAVAVAIIEPHAETVVFCGVGNISCAVRYQDVTRSCVSHNGIVGHQIRKIQEFQMQFRRGALMIAHSDGLSTHWDLAAYPGLEAKPPSLIAGVLYRDHHRQRDDATVVVLRNAGVA